MEQHKSTEALSFLGRVALGLRLVFNSEFAGQVMSGLNRLEAPKAGAGPKAPAPERLHASGLLLLSALQREGRWIDFLQQDIAGFSDEEVGAAARVVHSGCRRVLKQYFDLDPVASEAEGGAITVPQGFDARKIRLTGNVTGQAPFRGTLKHHGWIAREIRMPALSEALDPRVVAPAEVEMT